MLKEIGIVVFNGIERLDFEGPLGVLAWTALAPGGSPVNIRFLSKDGKAICDHLVRRPIATDDVIEHVSSLDLLIVPGGNLGQFVDDDVLVGQIKDLMPRCRIVASVCTGAFLIARTNLVNGKQMATHHDFHERFKKRFKEVRLIEQRYVNDGTLWSSAGISAGIDMSLRLVKSYWDEETVKFVQARLEYFPEPPYTRKEIQGER